MSIPYENVLDKFIGLESFYKFLLLVTEFFHDSGFDRVRTYRVSVDGKALVVVKHLGGGCSEEFHNDKRLLIEDNAYARSTIFSGNIRLYSSIEKNYRFGEDSWKNLTGKEDVNQWLEFPIVIKDKVKALFCIDNKYSKKKIKQLDIDVLKNLQLILSDYAEKIYSLEEAKKNTTLLKKLDKIDTEIIGEIAFFGPKKNIKFENLCKYILTQLLKITNAAHCEIRFVSQDYLFTIAEEGNFKHGLGEINLKDLSFQYSLTKKAIDEKKRQIHIGSRNDPFFEKMYSNTSQKGKDIIKAIKSWGCFPLMTGRDIIGVINIHSLNYDFFDNHTIWTILNFASKISLVLNLRTLIGDYIDTVELEGRKRAEIMEKLSILERAATSSEIAGRILHDFGNNISEMSLFANNIKSIIQKNAKLSSIQKLTLKVDAIHEKIEKFDEILEIFRKLKWQPTEKKSNNINNIIEEAVNLCKTRADRYNIQIKLKLDGNFSDIFCSEFGMLQVFANLTYNALDSMSSKEKNVGKVLEIKTVFKDNFCIILFSDHGCGILQENLSKIFEPLYTTKASEGGTGTGLSSSKRIVEEHKGQIKVKSQIRKGTTFEIKIPIGEKYYV